MVGEGRSKCSGPCLSKLVLSLPLQSLAVSENTAYRFNNPLIEKWS